MHGELRLTSSYDFLLAFCIDLMSAYEVQDGAVVDINKIQKANKAIKTRLSSHETQPLQFYMSFASSPLDDLQPPTEDEVRR